MNTQECTVCGDCTKQQQNTLVILAGGAESPGQLSCHHQHHTYLEVQYGPGNFERTRTGG